jgi:hypothetical protein
MRVYVRCRSLVVAWRFPQKRKSTEKIEKMLNTLKFKQIVWRDINKEAFRLCATQPGKKEVGQRGS